MAKLELEMELPDELLHEFFQMIRDFEQRSPDKIHVKMVASSDLRMEELGDVTEVSPPLPFKSVTKFGLDN